MARRFQSWFEDQWSVPFGENRSDGGGFSSEFEEDGNSEDLADDDDMLLSLGEMDQIMDKLDDQNMSVSDRMLYGNLLLFGGRGPRSMPAVPEIDAPQPKLFPSRPPSPRSPRF
ncbi:hypothetical protein A0H81_09043 [Grifola frondosa]|uniref:Uncharacterized protein n=1 Tax=Grifola frondosa TaxID=5627 RepID=A0A1C7M246_GRIFR|nr:hypothetical protein A0H81_09043 [Grifola frondosa]